MQTGLFEIDGQQLHVGIRRGSSDRPPLLIYNGIGANLELAAPFIEALDDTTAIIFDVPGVGGSPMPSLPYRPSTLVRLGRGVIKQLGFDRCDVLGVSWGGAPAQQFAFDSRDFCRKLVLAATTPGIIMVPGSASVLMRMASPRRYADPDYMHRIAAEIYGGAFRTDPDLIKRHAEATKSPSPTSYLFQLAALSGWSSLPWLWSLRQPTLIIAGTDDPLVPVVNARIMATMLRDSRLELVDDGHLFLVTNPQQSARMIEAFLTE